MANLPIHNQVWDDNIMAFARACRQSLGVKSHDGDYPIVAWLKSHNLSKGRSVYLNSALKLMENEKLELQNENSSTKEALAQVKRDLEFQTKMTKEARKIEKEFRSTDPENEAATSIPALKRCAESLKARLDLTKAKLEPTSKPSLLQLMFPSFIKDPNVSRASLVDCIEMLESELSSLEEERDVAPQSGKDDKRGLEVTEGSKSGSEKNVAKRSRVSGA